MTFVDNLESIQKKLKNAGYESVREPFDISSLEKQYSVKDCEIIAKKDFYNILYMEAKSNWRGISTDVVKKNHGPCLVITKYLDSHIILSTMSDHSTLHAKPRYVVININSKTYSIEDFIKLIKIDQKDTIIEIDKKMHDAFDKFSEYHEALKEFTTNLENIIINTKTMIKKAIQKNKNYNTEANKLLKMCKQVINDSMSINDIDDMLLQHILTYKIFIMVYDDHNFHHTNTIAKSLESLKILLKIPTDTINYKTMELIAESITDANHKQDFLKQIYETFYKKYDPAKADRDGIIYTPTELVNFMVVSTDQLLRKHFHKDISDGNVTILDPATGTGTFPVHILRQISLDKLEQKYSKEIFANEISILPYYIAALNIEHTYKELRGEFKEFENICWMDTLDSGVKDYSKMTTWLEDTNIKRISRQQKSNIHVIIGNPPWRVGQESANDTNPSKLYDKLDEEIKIDYIKRSNAKKPKSHDMYKRFLKWSTSRIKKNGMIVFVHNNSFLDVISDDGMRKSLYDEFDYIYTINLKGNLRYVTKKDKNDEGENIFNIMLGTAVSFFIKTGENHSEIQYAEIPNAMKKNEKLMWLRTHTISTINFKKIIPNDNAVWLNQINNDFDNLVPILPRECNESIFQISNMGIATNKDEWVYDFNELNLKKKMKYYISFYNDTVKKYKTNQSKINTINEWVDKKIKWSDDMYKSLKKFTEIKYSDTNIRPTLYRPFVIKYQYYDKIITHRMRDFHNHFINSQKNLFIVFPTPATRTPFNVTASQMFVDANCFDGAQCIPIWNYDCGKKYSNITTYALKLFATQYSKNKIIGDDIFYYVYAMLNDPKYVEKYKINLRRHFPRIPLVENFDIFTKYVSLGKELFYLHCHFDKSEKYNFKRIDKTIKNNKTKLKLDEENGKFNIILDDKTILKNISKDMLKYTLGPKNPLEWVLGCYKDKKNKLTPKYGSNDEMIRKKFNTYEFNEHKEKIITLLNHVATVCVKTNDIHKKIELLDWGQHPKLIFTQTSKNAKIINKAPNDGVKKKIKKKKLPIKNINDTTIDVY